jgi:type IV pilus assembly protein PilW
LIFPVQGYDTDDESTRADIATPTTCDSVSASVPNPINDANLVPGTDILVIRRADTSTTTLPVLNDVYIQSSIRELAVQFGNPAGFAVGALDSANNVSVIGTSAGGATAGSAVVNPSAILRVANNSGASPGNYATRLAANVRKYHVHIYFVAPCSRPTGGGLSCTGATDDGGAPVPTLKRLELTSVGGVTLMSLVPLVEGIENMQVEYGIDDAPTTANANTGLLGDGVPDTYKNASDATLTDWAHVVTARIYLLARNVLPTNGYTDTKQYELGPLGLTLTPGGNFKRHLYSAEVRLINPSARREIP